jgi:hypothetical protein
VKYKEIWDRHIDNVIDVVAILQREDAAPQAKSKSKKVKTAKELREALEKNRELREERIRNAQSTFNQALAKYKERRR